MFTPMGKGNENYICKQITKSLVLFISNHFSENTRNKLFSIISKLGVFEYKVSSFFSQFIMQGYMVIGREKHSGEKIKILFLNFDEFHFSYLSNLIFSKEKQISKVKKVCLFNINKKLESYSNEIDAVFVNSDRFYISYFERNNFTLIPAWISVSLDISRPIEIILSDFRSSIRKKIKKIEDIYYYSISTKKEDFDYFYHDLYMPYSKHRFDDNLHLNNYYNMRLLFGDSRLLFVNHGDEKLLGILVKNINSHSALLAFTGIKKGKFHHVDNDIGTASTYFSIIWAKNHNFTTLDFGLCRPFFDDGIFQHNKGWRVRIDPFYYEKGYNFHSAFCFKQFNLNKGIMSFLENNPYIFQNSHLKGVVYTSKEVTCDMIKTFFKKYYMDGIKKIKIVSNKPFDEEVKKFVAENYGGLFILRNIKDENLSKNIP